MKFNQSTLFFIILTVVLLSTVGMNIKEGMVDSNKQRASQQTNQRYEEEMSKRNDLYNDDDMHDRFWSERKGVRRVDIPDDDQDLYVLKSSIVPPVCPKCHSVQLVQETNPLLLVHHALAVQNHLLLVKGSKL